MTGRVDVDSLVNDWLAAGSSASGSDRVLAAALERVAATPQERHVTQWLFGDRLGRSPTLRFALLGAGLLLLAAGAVAAIGMFLPQPSPPPLGGRNGWIAYSTSKSNHDISIVDAAGAAHVLVGSLQDGLDQGCSVFGRDGSSLGYVESTSPSDTSESWSAVVLSLEADGSAGREQVRLRQPGPLKSGCPRWSPDLTRVAWVTTPADREGDLEFTQLDGTHVTAMRGDAGLLELAGWSPDGRLLAVVRTSGPDFRDAALWVVATDGSQPRELIGAAPGQLIGSVSWSADGSEIGFVGSDIATGTRTMMIVALTTGRARSFDAGANAGGPAWSPDGSRIAYVADGLVVVSAPDGSDRRVLPPVMLGVRAYAQGVAWSPDGTRLLVTAGDATFIDRGVHFAIASVDPAGLGSPQLIAPWQLGFYTDVGWQSVPR